VDWNEEDMVRDTYEEDLHGTAVAGCGCGFAVSAARDAFCRERNVGSHVG
jgi:hypothetical protein